jgi:glutathione S-transferase
MYTLHIANKNYSSWSLRPWVMMKTAGIDFHEETHIFSANDSNAEAFSKFSPTALVPCLVDGELVVWESMAIMEYLAERHDGLWPADPIARAFARCAGSEMHAGFSALRNDCPMSVGIRMKLHSISDGLSANLDRLDALWTEGLERFGGPFLAGDRFTIADAMYCPVAFRIHTYDLPLSDEARAYAQRLLEVSAMQDWYAKGVAEPHRETQHEDEINALGKVLGDFRA